MAIDSKLSLDRVSTIGKSWAMFVQPYQLYIERTDPAKNMARYYVLSIEPTLFSTLCLTRRWDRIGSGGQSVEHHFDGERRPSLCFSTSYGRNERENTRWYRGDSIMISFGCQWKRSFGFLAPVDPA